jgi:hypothetical protein
MSIGSKSNIGKNNLTKMYGLQFSFPKFDPPSVKKKNPPLFQNNFLTLNSTFFCVVARATRQAQEARYLA